MVWHGIQKSCTHGYGNSMCSKLQTLCSISGLKQTSAEIQNSWQKTVMQLQIRRETSENSVPASLFSLGIIHLMKWGMVLFRVVISLLSDSYRVERRQHLTVYYHNHGLVDVQVEATPCWDRTDWTQLVRDVTQEDGRWVHSNIHNSECAELDPGKQSTV